VISKGEWDNKHFVSKAWIEESLKPAVPTEDGSHYGRLWFLGEAPTPALAGNRPWIGGFGNGGQRLWIMPDVDLVTVTFSGNYNQWDSWISQTRVWREIVLDNLLKLETGS
jgi:CubicO group peptidase (beta-lactamase class C family)